MFLTQQQQTSHERSTARVRSTHKNCPHKRFKLIEREEMAFGSETRGRTHDSVCTRCGAKA